MGEAQGVLVEEVWPNRSFDAGGLEELQAAAALLLVGAGVVLQELVVKVLERAVRAPYCLLEVLMCSGDKFNDIMYLCPTTD